MDISYCEVDDIKNAMPDTVWTDTYDSQLSSFCVRASRLIDTYLRKDPGTFGVAATSIRYYKARGGSILDVDEMAAAPTEVAVMEDGTNYTVWASTDYILWPYNALAMGLPYTRLIIDLLHGTKSVWYTYERGVRITAKFGFSTIVPEDIKMATIVQTIRWFKRAMQGFQDTGAITELYQLQYTRKLDPEVELILNGFERIAI